MRVIGTAALVCGLGLLALSARADTADKIPITTGSEAARQTYVKARELAENLRATDAHRLYLEVLAKDKDFALAHLGSAQTAGNAKEFFEALARAVALADKVSEPERLLILAQDAGAKADGARQLELLGRLVALRPKDERAHNALALAQFVRQEPGYAPPYNQLGYAYRFTDKYADAEKSFKKYIELIPKDPNPYDSYAELLMKMGRFDESIQMYEKALAIDKNFVASYVGIGNDQMFAGHGAQARATFARLTAVARNEGERRLALFWTAVSFVHEGATDQALAQAQKEYAIAEAAGDLVNLSGDLNFMGNILLEAGRADQALAKFKQGVEVIGRADAPVEVKQQTARNALFDEARVALAKKDLATAKARADSYARAVAEKKDPFEVRQQHELAGMIALDEKKYDVAVAELDQASQQDPRVLYLLAVALHGKGDVARARELAVKAADFNALGVNYAYVRKHARELKAKIQG